MTTFPPLPCNIISVVAIAFVYREVAAFTASSDGGLAKRKAANNIVKGTLSSDDAAKNIVKGTTASDGGSAKRKAGKNVV